MKRFFASAVLLGLCLLGMSCGSSNSSLSQNSNSQASVFVTGEDAPASSVVGFNVTIKPHAAQWDLNGKCDLVAR
ncbi:MAG TPA: hypothetical protein VKB49_19415, partial [Candidatus Sulfotelmatobacter sp.]|nr:hypothetical protein [Candidatus Sulfotelmatobacter sp.]